VSSPAKPARSTSPSSSGDWSELSISPLPKGVAAAKEHNHLERDSPRSAPATSITPPPACNFQGANENEQRANPKLEKKTLIDHCPPPRSSAESLRIVAKDSLEDLHTSPRCVKDDSPLPAIDEVKDATGKEICITLPDKLQKKSLTLKIDGADFELEKKKNKKRRPLSPFTSSGALRRMMSPTPPSAPAAVTEFGPTVAEEVAAQLAREKECRELEKAKATKVGTTRAERGGKILLGFLGKRIGRVE
jgi:hypothetical protein